METVEYIGVSNRCMLIAPAKFSECQRSILPSSFYRQLPNIFLVNRKSEWHFMQLHHLYSSVVHF